MSQSRNDALPIHTQNGAELADDELSDQALDAVVAGYQAWFTCLKSCADSKGQVQGELARFR